MSLLHCPTDEDKSTKADSRQSWAAQNQLTCAMAICSSAFLKLRNSAHTASSVWRVEGTCSVGTMRQCPSARLPLSRTRLLSDIKACTLQEDGQLCCASDCSLLPAKLASSRLDTTWRDRLLSKGAAATVLPFQTGITTKQGRRSLVLTWQAEPGRLTAQWPA